MTEPITGKIAAIIDDTTLVLSVGSRDGVREGMVFAIVSTHQDIADPDSGESLGTWEAVKARVVVSHVQERMATVRSPLQEEVDASGTLSTLMVRHSFGLYGARREERQSLNVRSSSVAGRPVAQPIQVGDLARSLALEGAAGRGPIASRDPEDATGGATEDLPSQTYGASSVSARDADAGATGNDEGEDTSAADAESRG